MGYSFGFGFGFGVWFFWFFVGTNWFGMLCERETAAVGRPHVCKMATTGGVFRVLDKGFWNSTRTSWVVYCRYLVIVIRVVTKIMRLVKGAFQDPSLAKLRRWSGVGIGRLSWSAWYPITGERRGEILSPWMWRVGY